MDCVETIECRGREIKIYQDDNPMNPRVDFDNMGKMVCWHSRYTLGDEQPSCDPETYLNGLARAASPVYDEAAERLQEIENRLSGWHWSEGDKEMVPGEHIQLWVKAQKFVEKLKERALSQYVILPLSLYDHSGISMSVGRASGWDCGQVGFIYCDVTKAREELATSLCDAAGWNSPCNDWMNPGKQITLKEITERCLRAEVETYDQYLRGDVYGYEAGDDSCWGFFGHDHKTSGLLEQAENAIDSQIHHERHEHCEALKTQIKNHVPLRLRKPMAA